MVNSSVLLLKKECATQKGKYEPYHVSQNVEDMVKEFSRVFKLYFKLGNS